MRCFVIRSMSASVRRAAYVIFRGAALGALARARWRRALADLSGTRRPWIIWQCQPGNVEALEFYDRINGRRFAAANFELAGDALAAIADTVPGTD